MINNNLNPHCNSLWEKLFIKNNIAEKVVEEGFFELNPQIINSNKYNLDYFGFEHQSHLPDIFRKHSLAILPTSFNTSLIGQYSAYIKCDNFEHSPIDYINFPDYIQSVDYENIPNGITAINCALLSGLLHNFLEEDSFCTPTLSGKFTSDDFLFKIDTIDSRAFNIKVSNCKISVGSVIESIKSLSIIESINYIPTDIFIQKIYYPFRYWSGVVEKNIRPILMFVSNGIYYLHEYEFREFDNYSSIALIKSKRYSFEINDISLEDIQDILYSVDTVDEPAIPFPQADSFERVINLCELLLKHSELTKKIITSTYDFDKRQTDYYTNAGRYLGLIDKKNENGVKYFLSDEGKNLFKLNFKKRQLKLVELILKHPVFSKSLSLYLKNAEAPAKLEIEEIMKESNLYKVNTDATYSRRAFTVLSWINWILSLQQ